MRHTTLTSLIFVTSLALPLNAQNPYGRWSHGLPGDSSYFPIAVWLQEPPDAARYKAAGITVYVGLWDGPTDVQLSGLRPSGMRVICEQNAVGLAHRNDSIIVGWNWGDEPDNAQWNEATQTYDPCISTDSVTAVYNRMHSADSTRPLLLNLGMGVSWTGWYGRGTCTGHTEQYPLYCRGADVVSYDIYPVVSTDATIQGKLWYVPKGVDSLRLWSGDKPTWCWIECTHISNAAVKPTPAQVRSEVWMALIHGAAGFGYFCHEFAPTNSYHALLLDTAMLTAVTAINQRVKSLAPALNSLTIANGASVTSSNGAVPVSVMVKQRGTTTYLFAVAMRPGAIRATFTLQNTGVSGLATVLDESRTVTVTNGVFQDSIQDYGVHLYQIPNSVAVRAAVKGSLSSQVDVRHSVAYDMAGRRLARAGMGGHGVFVAVVGPQACVVRRCARLEP
jgi:hypothetical protein